MPKKAKPAADAPAEHDFSAEIEKLITKGREQGFVTQQEIQATVPMMCLMIQCGCTCVKSVRYL